MTKRSVEAIVAALNASGVRYLVAGGLAVVAHGYLRFTADVDMMIDLEPQNVERAIEALEGLGYRPRAPVAFREFADPGKREKWVKEKGLTVFSLFSDEHAATEIDLFVEPPLDFDAAYESAARFDVAPGVEAVFVGYEDLLRLKQQAGRQVDLEDIERLKAIRDSND
jgi:predicted nucleotidyltransferase